MIEVCFKTVNLRSELLRVVDSLRFDDFPAHFDDVFDLGLDVREGVVDAFGMMELFLNTADVRGGKFSQVQFLTDVAELSRNKEACIILEKWKIP